MALTNEVGVRFSVGDLLLEGRLAHAADAQRAVVVCHPHPQYGGTMDNNVVEAVTRRLQREGIATLRFNFRGVGASQGSYGHMVGECDDARAAARFVQECTGFAAVTLAGYSFGAVAALRAGYDNPFVERLIAIAPPLSMFDVDFLRECRKPKLLLVGEHDQYCPLDVFDRSVATLAEPTSCTRLADADHFFLGQEEELAAHVAGFAARA